MKIICIGRNYSEHARELGNAVPEQPVIFIKPDTAILKNSDFYLPNFSNEIHHEIEIVLKISKGGKCIQKENAAKHFEEITVGIDFTARDLQAELKGKGLPWELAKGFDGSAVVGKFVDKRQLAMEEVTFELKKNGKTVQQGTPSQMIFNFEDIVAFASQYFTLKAGDLIFTGTPAGVGGVAEGDELQGFLNDAKIFDIYVR